MVGSGAGSNANLGASVVPDLMRVYESLTQSKTPQTGTQAPPIPSERTSTGDSENDEPSRNYHYDPFSSDHTSLLRHVEQHEQHFQYDPAIQAAAAILPPPAGDEMQQSLTSKGPSPVQSRERNIKKVRPKRTTSRKRSGDFVDKSESDSDTAKNRRKKGSDGRWSKRFAWPDELHRDFVSAVFDVGLKHSSPSSILEQMPPHEQITTERIKSHLQKYRLHRQKSKKEFMASYESTLLKMKSGDHDLDASTMNCGEVAAHLSFSAMNEKEITSIDPSSLVKGGVLQLPQLTEEEKRSPVGASMGYLMGLFFSLKQQLQIQREGKHQNGDGPAITPSTSPQSSVVLPTDPAPSNAASAAATYSGSGWKNTGMSTSSTLDFHAQGHHPSTQFDVASGNAAVPHPAHASHYQQQYYQGFPAQQHATSAAMASGPLSGSVSSNLPSSEARSSTVMEESNMMKRDMKSQMVFQNKMRKLKEQELSKYTQATESTSDANAASSSSVPDYNIGQLSSNADGTGKNDNDSMAIGGSDFWGSEEVLDEKLFEFLMND
jgi:myb-like DNA-binding domain, SHAQKYF class